MLTKQITYRNFNDEEVTRPFYFNYTVLELLEKDLEVGGFENLVKRLGDGRTSAQEAYQILKTIITHAYGEKSDDGELFLKTPEIRAKLENSPAVSELIIELLGDAEAAASFIEATLPKRKIEEMNKLRAEQQRNEKSKSSAPETTTGVELPASEPQLESEEQNTAAEKTITDYTRDELLAMPQDEFDKLAGTDPNKMEKTVLQIAFQRRTSVR